MDQTRVTQPNDFKHGKEIRQPGFIKLLLGCNKKNTAGKINQACIWSSKLLYVNPSS
jgi:hypothetical protein